MPEPSSPTPTIHPSAFFIAGFASIGFGTAAFLSLCLFEARSAGLLLAAAGLLGAIVELVLAIRVQRQSTGLPVAGALVCGCALIPALFGPLPSRAVNRGDVLALPGVDKNAVSTAAVQDAAIAINNLLNKNSEPEPAKDEWSSAEKPVRVGDVELSIKYARIGRVTLRNDIRERDEPSDTDLFAIQIQVNNRSTSKKIDFRGWSQPSAFVVDDIARLKDSFGNSYNRPSFGIFKVQGTTSSASLYPGGSLEDIVCFELPVDKAEYFDLELSTKGIGAKGFVRIRIPTAMVARQ